MKKPTIDFSKHILIAGMRNDNPYADIEIEFDAKTVKVNIILKEIHGEESYYSYPLGYGSYKAVLTERTDKEIHFNIVDETKQQQKK